MAVDGKPYRARPFAKMNIKPCPFCGAEPVADKVTFSGNLTPWHVVCANYLCSAQPRVYGKTPTAAVEAWNRRAGDEV